jgi:hypothetical protein
VPGLARLDDLVGALQQAGRTVEVLREPAGDHAPLPAPVDQAAFRIIQEALTNVVRHADSPPRPSGDPYARVGVLEIADDGPTTRRTGCRQRHPGHGGAGPGGRRHAADRGRPGGGVLVHADLPIVEVTGEHLGGPGRRPGPGPDGSRVLIESEDDLELAVRPRTAGPRRPGPSDPP